MSRASDAANSVVAAVETAAALYRVPCFRMQTRTFNVVGKGGRIRPMFIGEWMDELGEKHRKGMADLLLQPNIQIPVMGGSGLYTTVPLWVECKYGTGDLEGDQIRFKRYVEKFGAYHITAHDSADLVMEFFEKYKVRRI